MALQLPLPDDGMLMMLSWASHRPWLRGLDHYDLLMPDGCIPSATGAKG